MTQPSIGASIRNYKTQEKGFVVSWCERSTRVSIAQAASLLFRDKLLAVGVKIQEGQTKEG